jgi:hypothetical protein
MSVRTTADAARDKAREHVGAAVKELSTILIEEVWGHDDYSKEYLETLNDVFVKLIQIKKQI